MFKHIGQLSFALSKLILLIKNAYKNLLPSQQIYVKIHKLHRHNHIARLHYQLAWQNTYVAID